MFGALTNLNPLLEWDGYFMLMDWLEIPMLRKRSMDFVRRNLLNKVTSRSSFSREEKIFAIFGVMAVLYTVGMIGFALFFWQSRVSSVLDYAGGWIFWLLIGLIGVVIGIPLLLGVGVLAYRAAQRARLWVYHRFLMGRPGHQVTAMVTAGIVVAVPAALLGKTASDTYLAVCGGLALATALMSSVRVAPWYLGSRLQWFFLALPWLIALLLLGQVLGPIGGPVNTLSDVLTYGVLVALFLALAYLSPTLISFTGTVLQGAWALLVSGVGLQVIGTLVVASTTGDAATSLPLRSMTR